MRTKAEKRHNDWKKAIRKKKIINAYGYELYDNLHEYSKNKIHCSCPMCSAKTKNKNRYAVYCPAHNWSPSDQRKIDEMEDQILDNE